MTIMANSLTIGQPLAEELGLPEAREAPATSMFALQRMLELQDEVMRRIEARRKQVKQPSFLAPERGCRYGVARKDD